MPRFEQLPLVRDYVFVQGATWRRRFVYKPGGEPMAFGAGWQALLQIRDVNGRLLTSISTADGGVVLGETDGSISLELSEAKTRAIVRSGMYALEISGPGETIPFLRGRARYVTEVATA